MITHSYLSSCLNKHQLHCALRRLDCLFISLYALQPGRPQSRNFHENICRCSLHHRLRGLKSHTRTQMAIKDEERRTEEVVEKQEAAGTHMYEQPGTDSRARDGSQPQHTWSCGRPVVPCCISILNADSSSTPEGAGASAALAFADSAIGWPRRELQRLTLISALYLACEMRISLLRLGILRAEHG